MPRYTLLVLSKDGSISSCQEGDGNWGRKECPPVFDRVSVTLTKQQLDWAMSHCTFDIDSGHFQFEGVRFDFDDIPTGSEREDDAELRLKDQALELELFGNNMAHPCLSLAARHAKTEAWMYWFETLYRFRWRDWFSEDLLEALKRGCYADLRSALKALPGSAWSMIDTLDEKDSNYLRWLSGNY